MTFSKSCLFLHGREIQPKNFDRCFRLHLLALEGGRVSRNPREGHRQKGARHKDADIRAQGHKVAGT